MNSAERNAAAQKTFLITFIVNLLLTFFKFAAAVLGNSAAMLSDAVHTLTDLCTTPVSYTHLNSAHFCKSKKQIEQCLHIVLPLCINI